MQRKTKKFINYLSERNMNWFDIESDDDCDILRHQENINDFPILSAIVIDGSACTKASYVLARCTDVSKRDEIILFLNELNCTRKLSYCMADNGSIIASFYYWADDSEFNCEDFFTLYVMFARAVTEDGHLHNIMKIIWK